VTGRTLSGGKFCQENNKVDRVVHDTIAVRTSNPAEDDVSEMIDVPMIEDSQQEIDVSSICQVHLTVR